MDQKPLASNFPTPYSIPTLTLHEDTSLSKIVATFREGALAMLANGASHTEVVDLDVLDVTLFFRARASNDPFSVCSWASEVWRSFEDWDIYVRLGLILMYTTVMRWKLVPNQRHYVAMPDLIKPRSIQYWVPHQLELDFLPLPPLREALIKKGMDWMTLYPAASLSVNWDRGLDDAVIWDGGSLTYRLSEAFIGHATTYRNWGVDEGMLEIFPEIKNLIRTHHGTESEVRCPVVGVEGVALTARSQTKGSSTFRGF